LVAETLAAYQQCPDAKSAPAGRIRLRTISLFCTEPDLTGTLPAFAGVRCDDEVAQVPREWRFLTSVICADIRFDLPVLRPRIMFSSIPYHIHWQMDGLLFEFVKSAQGATAHDQIQWCLWCRHNREYRLKNHSS
jgi:hypothetical protein